MTHLCIGCGICASNCPKSLIQMSFSQKEGFYLPSTGMDSCDTACGVCERVCPFIPDSPSTAEMAKTVYGGIDGIRHDDILGFYLGTFVGYSELHRPKSASGGLLSWILETLLLNKEIDGALCVSPDQTSPTLFSYKICRTVEELRSCSGSCYQPVEISPVLDEILRNPGRYAVVALPCFAHGLRLAMKNRPKLRSCITYIFGLVCGQQKSRHFVDYLAYKSGIGNAQGLLNIEFRHKVPNRPACDYTYKFKWKNGQEALLGWSETVGKPWIERWFTLEACDFCDDVFSECADATFMDAWLPEYSSSPKGHTICIVRNEQILKTLQEKQVSHNISLKPIAPSRVLDSQIPVIRQKRCLAFLNAKELSGKRKSRILRRAGAKANIIDHLERWAKVRIRTLTQFGIPSHIFFLERRINRASLPWRIVRLVKKKLGH